MGHTINIEHDWEEITYENLIIKHLEMIGLVETYHLQQNEAIKRDVKIDPSMNFQEITHMKYMKRI